MYIERQIKKDFIKRSEVYNIIALVGARQSGKTTFLKEQMKNANYILFDDPDARNLFEEDIKKFEKQYLQTNKLAVLDEVHYCKNAGRKLKYLAEQGHKMWITSSSEMILKKEVLSFLVGRVSIMKLFPFSLDELLKSKNIHVTNNNILKRSVWEHIIYGGYPKVVLTEDIELKRVLLKDLAETMILKDIARTFSIEDIDSLEKFTRYVANIISSVLSYNDIANDLNMSFQTIKKYLEAMEKSHLVRRIYPFFSNKNKEITKQPKVYFIDCGLRNSIINNFYSEPDGQIFENYVFSELLKAGFEPKFWRSKSKSEVDFIIEKNNEIIPIEVKISPNKIERSFRSFIDEYKPKRAYIVNYAGVKKKRTIDKTKIEFLDIEAFINRIKR
jgi:hypothetical protein